MSEAFGSFSRELETLSVLFETMKFVTLGSHSFFQSWTQCLELFACFSLNIYKIKTKNIAVIL